MTTLYILSKMTEQEGGYAHPSAEVLGVFDDAGLADAAYEKMDALYKGYPETYLTIDIVTLNQLYE